MPGGFASQIRYPQAVLLRVRRLRSFNPSLALSSCFRAHLLLSFLFAPVPDPWTHRSPWDSSRRRVSGGSGAIGCGACSLLVCAFSALVLKRFGHVVGVVLDWGHRVVASSLEHLAPGHAGDLPRLLSLVCI